MEKKTTLKPSQNQYENLEVPLQKDGGPHTRMVFQILRAVTLSAARAASQCIQKRLPD